MHSKSVRRDGSTVVSRCSSNWALLTQAHASHAMPWGFILGWTKSLRWKDKETGKMPKRTDRWTKWANGRAADSQNDSVIEWLDTRLNCAPRWISITGRNRYEAAKLLTLEMRPWFHNRKSPQLLFPHISYRKQEPYIIFLSFLFLPS